MLNQMIMLFTLGFLTEGVEGITLFIRHKKALQATFGSSAPAYNTDFLRTLGQGIFGLGLCAVLVLSLVRKSRDLPQPFDLDFLYVASIMYLGAAAMVETIKYLPLFLINSRRK